MIRRSPKSDIQWTFSVSGIELCYMPLGHPLEGLQLFRRENFLGVHDVHNQFQCETVLVPIIQDIIMDRLQLLL